MAGMSFSAQVKAEISQVKEAARHCNIAEFAALVNFCGIIEQDVERVSLILKTESPLVAQRFEYIAEECFGIRCRDEGYVHANSDKRTYMLQPTDGRKLQRALLAAGILDERKGNAKKRIYPLIIKNSCCKMSYIRSAFICCGSISDPRGAYHMEFVLGEEDGEYIKAFTEMFRFFELRPKSVRRKQNTIVYFKEGEQIADIMRIIGAPVSLMEFEDCRARKYTDNDINRKANCQSANDDKAITASAQHIRDIQLIGETIGLEALSPQLRNVAEVRLENPLCSMQELGTLLSPPVSKSGVNHRLRKIASIAQNIRE